MGRSFSVEQMIGLFKQAQVGVLVAEVNRRAGINDSETLTVVEFVYNKTSPM